MFLDIYILSTKIEKFFLSEYGLHLKNIQNGRWCYIFERIFKIFPWRSSFAVPILVDLAKFNCAFWHYSNFLCLLCRYETQKNHLSKNLKFCTHSQCSLAHMLQRHILSSNHEPPFLFRNFEISALLTREKRPTMRQNKILVSFTQHGKYDDHHYGKLVSITVLRTKNCIFTENCLMCTHQAQNREYLNVKNLIWTPGDNFWRANSWGIWAGSCVSLEWIALKLTELWLISDFSFREPTTSECFNSVIFWGWTEDIWIQNHH